LRRVPAKPAGWSVAAKRLRNLQQYTFQIFPDLAVFKAKHMAFQRRGIVPVDEPPRLFAPPLLEGGGENP